MNFNYMLSLILETYLSLFNKLILSIGKFFFSIVIITKYFSYISTSILTLTTFTIKWHFIIKFRGKLVYLMILIDFFISEILF